MISMKIMVTYQIYFFISLRLHLVPNYKFKYHAKPLRII